jgi:hypothetical protein
VEDGKAIHCMVCGMVSWHPEDVRHLYCGWCHVFHEQLIVLSYEHFARLLGTVQAAYKTGRGDAQIPAASLAALCEGTLRAVMGDDAFARWEGSL